MSEFQRWWDENGDEFDYYTQRDACIATLKWILQKNHIAKMMDGEEFVFVDFIEQELEEIKNE